MTRFILDSIKGNNRKHRRGKNSGKQN